MKIYSVLYILFFFFIYISPKRVFILLRFPLFSFRALIFRAGARGSLSQIPNYDEDNVDNVDNLDDDDDDDEDVDNVDKVDNVDNVDNVPRRIYH